jgi:hypothetical protein
MVEWSFKRKQVNNFLTAKTVSLYTVPVTIGLIFYGYTAIIDKEILIIDILSFLFAVALAQFLSYKILRMSNFPRFSSLVSFLFAIALATIMAVLVSIHLIYRYFIRVINQSFGNVFY